MLRILDITAPDINNGNGIRVTLWVAGCNHQCKGCHNKLTWNFNQGKPFLENQDEILNKLSDWLSRDYVDGLTLSGGDPLCQDSNGLKEIQLLINWVRRNYPDKTIWLYTGYTKEEMLEGLRDIGVFHLAEKQSADREVADRFQTMSRVSMALKDYADERFGKTYKLFGEQSY